MSPCCAVMDTRNGPLGLTLEDYWCTMPAMKDSRFEPDVLWLSTKAGPQLRSGSVCGRLAVRLAHPHSQL